MDAITASTFAIEQFLPHLGLLMVVIGVVFVINLGINAFRDKVIRDMKLKRQRSSFILFMRVAKYVIAALVIAIALWSYYGSLQNAGWVLGVMSIALGFALQKPLTGMVAWIGIIIKRPFGIGDRVSIGEVRGDVVDITPSHIFLEEVGRYGGEELTGRIILIPNANLFDSNMINYSYRNDYVLAQVTLSVTYESDFDEAIRLVIDIAEQHTKDFNKAVKKEAHYRMRFMENGIELNVRYYVPVQQAQKITTDISYDIHKAIQLSEKVDIAYPHISVMQKKG